MWKGRKKGDFAGPQVSLAHILPLFHKRSVREVPLHFGTRWDIMRYTQNKRKCVAVRVLNSFENAF